MPIRETNAEPDPRAIALGALGWAVSDGTRADRLLATTGLDPAGLRARAGEAATLAAVLSFIEAHEPDLIACADALGVEPAVLVQARMRLEGE
ncbi:hypothetical protein COC42_10605 [Sphingomonas spermidinifaciens]|uniref:DUF3572 domain-containing protein n=1 Tax=Sphingomonas spermidinifaciens TaxID=1141889 RepID=A0A2A4B1V8_9SPHN|nr:DUF3572 domain-containing protein [Sphingomonas spermidinifaciens]PCD01945.1 hypothetical protein COC42_10605 [Sphingomonas spermidinifaciens]